MGVFVNTGLRDMVARVYGLTATQLDDTTTRYMVRQYSRDTAIEAVFEYLERTLKFNDAQLDKASELYFETFQSAKAISPDEFANLFQTDVVRKAVHYDN